MFLRIFSLVSFVVLVGCGRTSGGNKVVTADPSRRIECALAGARVFTKSCAIEPNRQGTALTLRHPAGGFRQLAVSADRALMASDGADVLVGHPLPDGRLEITVAGDRYRLPRRK